MLFFLYDVAPDPTIFEEISGNNYLPWILAGVSLAGIVVLIYFIYRRRKKEKETDKKA